MERSTLDAVQHRLWHLITQPDGVDAALRAGGDAERAALDTLIRADRGISAADRLSVYANAYFARVHECLQDDFPALARALGPDAFHDLVKTHLMMHPPRHASLRHVGMRLAEHLATEPFSRIFSRRCPYAADLARFEAAMIDVFFAPDAVAVTRADLAQWPPDAWPTLRFRPIPALRIVSCAWPVNEIRERFDREEDDAVWPEVPLLDRCATEILVFRSEERVRYRAITALECAALGAAIAGETFATICERLADETGADDAARTAASFLAAWTADGLLARDG